MQITLFILSIVILGVYTSSIASFGPEDSKQSRVYCLASQLAFLAPVLCQFVSFFSKDLIWATCSNLISALCFVVLLITQNGFGIAQWSAKRNKILAIGLVAGSIALSQALSNPPYLNSFMTTLILSFLIHLRDRRDFKQQKVSLESVKSKLLSLDSKKHNEKLFQNDHQPKIRKI